MKFEMNNGREFGIPVVKYVVGLLAAVVAIILLFGSWTIINPGQRGVRITLGSVSDQVLAEGVHMKIPLVQTIKKIDVTTQKLEQQVEAYSQNIQSVDVKLALNYNCKPELVNRLLQQVGMDYEVRLLDPAIQESVKTATAKFNAQELVSERHKVKEEIKTELINRLGTYFVVTDFSLVNFSFSQEYEKAIEEKQIAEQMALKAKNDLDRIKLEADQRIAQAKGEAEAIKIQAEAITQQGGQAYVDLQAIAKWDGKLPVQMIPNAAVPFIDLTK